MERVGGVGGDQCLLLNGWSGCAIYAESVGPGTECGVTVAGIASSWKTPAFPPEYESSFFIPPAAPVYQTDYVVGLRWVFRQFVLSTAISLSS
jgi:hypothetical protein